mmetsp:Transcript_94807/g.263368  ORF Transcript_94807/g.263368 Transcript_94807/m.263368 type:complete len:231 (-) Transcript_94807:899-1591(-)
MPERRRRRCQQWLLLAPHRLALITAAASSPARTSSVGPVPAMQAATLRMQAQSRMLLVTRSRCSRRWGMPRSAAFATSNPFCDGAAGAPTRRLLRVLTSGTELFCQQTMRTTPRRPVARTRSLGVTSTVVPKAAASLPRRVSGPSAGLVQASTRVHEQRPERRKRGRQALTTQQPRAGAKCPGRALAARERARATAARVPPPTGPQPPEVRRRSSFCRAFSFPRPKITWT